MTQPGPQQGNDGVLWWKVAMHLDEAQLALANALGYNVDDPTVVLALQERLRDAQAILLEIFHAKRLLPAVVNEAPSPPSQPPSPPPFPVVPVAPPTIVFAPDVFVVDAPAAPPASAEQEAAIYEAAIDAAAPNGVGAVPVVVEAPSDARSEPEA